MLISEQALAWGEMEALNTKLVLSLVGALVPLMITSPPSLPLTWGGTDSEIQMGGDPKDGATGGMTQTFYVEPL